MGSITYTNYRDKWTSSFPTGGKHPFAGARARVGYLEVHEQATVRGCGSTEVCTKTLHGVTSRGLVEAGWPAENAPRAGTGRPAIQYRADVGARRSADS